MWFRRAALVACCSALLVAAAVPAQADMLYGASPASLVFDGGGKGLLRGGAAERSISLQNQGDERLTFVIGLEGASGAWLSVPDDTITLAPGSSYPLMVRATVPTTASNGAYEATVRITPAVAAEDGEGGASSTIVQEILVPVRIQVTDVQTLRLSVSRLSVPDSEENGRMFAEIDATNDGNVAARPDVSALVYDQEGEKMLETLRGTASTLAPASSARIVADLGPHGLDVGSYQVRLQASLADGEVMGGGPKVLYMDVLPEGTLALDVGAPKVSFGDGKARKGDLVPVRLTFQNAGEAPIVAGFTGLITKGGKPVEEVRLDPLEVASGGTGALEGFWRATDTGTFTLAGKLSVGAKRVDVEPATLTVKGGARDTPGFGVALALLAMAATAVALRRSS